MGARLPIVRGRPAAQDRRAHARAGSRVHGHPPDAFWPATRALGVYYLISWVGTSLFERIVGAGEIAPVVFFAVGATVGGAIAYARASARGLLMFIALAAITPTMHLAFAAASAIACLGFAGAVMETCAELDLRSLRAYGAAAVGAVAALLVARGSPVTAATRSLRSFAPAADVFGIYAIAKTLDTATSIVYPYVCAAGESGVHRCTPVDSARHILILFVWGAIAVAVLRKRPRALLNAWIVVAAIGLVWVAESVDAISVGWENGLLWAAEAFALPITAVLLIAALTIYRLAARDREADPPR